MFYLGDLFLSLSATYFTPVVLRIDHGDLTALLYMQGYRLDEFAE